MLSTSVCPLACLKMMKLHTCRIRDGGGAAPPKKNPIIFKGRDLPQGTTYTSLKREFFEKSDSF